MRKNTPQIYSLSQDKEIFSSDEKDTLEDIIETIFELEKDDQEYKDRKAFESCLRNLLSK